MKLVLVKMTALVMVFCLLEGKKQNLKCLLQAYAQKSEVVDCSNGRFIGYPEEICKTMSKLYRLCEAFLV